MPLFPDVLYFPWKWGSDSMMYFERSEEVLIEDNEQVPFEQASQPPRWCLLLLQRCWSRRWRRKEKEKRGDGPRGQISLCSSDSWSIGLVAPTNQLTNNHGQHGGGWGGYRRHIYGLLGAVIFSNTFESEKGEVGLLRCHPGGGSYFILFRLLVLCDDGVVPSSFLFFSAKTQHFTHATTYIVPPAENNLMMIPLLIHEAAML